MSHVHWLSKLALFIFNIQYHLGKTDKAADVFSWHPVNAEFKMEGDSNNDSEDQVVLFYATICRIMNKVQKGTKIPYSVQKKCKLSVEHLKGRSV